ncbi:serine hydrolase domain-containing protein [Streptosporangium sp. NPDC023963]|uniref:serine hydrolase domain-containing protein n=1 Tax=Streptosporangium sp. NPDC023963 TaxID=3155608 RepID=UPI003435D045
MYKPSSPRSRLLACGLAATIAVGTVAAPVAATASAPTSASAAAGFDDGVQKSLDGLIGKEFPGALASVRDTDGRVTGYTAGVGDLETRQEVPADGRVRIGSNTKTFVATVVLQLVGEGRIELDGPVERYLPGLVRGKAGDGRKITVRQLLQHTSGLPNYTRYMHQDFFKIQHRYVEPRDMIDVALRHRASFGPGKGWEYSNTGYLLLGLVVQQVTGRPIAEEVTRRVIDRAGLRDTYWPGVGDQTVKGPHPRGYTVRKPKGEFVDITTMDPSWGGAAGQLIGTPNDLNTFFLALLDGKLLRPAQLAEMKKTVKAPGFPEGWRYGLGVIKMKLSCGDTAWGHGGDIDGYETRNAATTDGRATAVAVTALPTGEAGALKVIKVVDDALCGAE